MAVHDTINIKGTPASDSDEMALVLLHQRPPLLDVNGTIHLDDFEPTMDEELAALVGQQTVEVDGRNDPDGEFNPVPLRIVRAESEEIDHEKHPGFFYEEGTKKTWSHINITYRRRRRTPAGFKSAKSKTEQKPALSDNSSGSSSYSKDDKDDDDFEPPTPTRKRGRKAGSKTAKRKMGQKSLLVNNSKPVEHTGGFVPVKRLVNFKIVLGDGWVVGRRVLPDRLRRTYYNLCDARNALLHRNLLKHISPMLAAEMIAETANIAEGIQASSADSLDDLVVWKGILESFEQVGMDVAFMRNRIEDLLRLLAAPSSTSSLEEPEGYEKAKREWARAAEQVRAIESRLSILKDVVKEMDAKVKGMVEASGEKKKDQAARKLVTAPW